MIEIGGTCLSQVKFKKKKQNESQKLFRDSFNICAFFPISFYFFYILQSLQQTYTFLQKPRKDIFYLQLQVNFHLHISFPHNCYELINNQLNFQYSKPFLGPCRQLRMHPGG